VVLTYADITQLKLLNLALANREKQAAAVTRLGRLALDAPVLNDVLDTAVREVAETLGVAFAKVLEILPGGDALRVRAGVGWREGTLGKATVSTSARSQAGYTLQTRDPVIVPNLAREKRFSAPTLLTDHGVVSGLSVIIGPLDQPFGVIGAHSAEHRTFGQDDANFLAAVSHILWAAVHRARFVAALEESEQRLRLALEAGQMGVWVWHVDTGASDWSDKMYALLGFEKGSIDPAGENFLNRIHPEDLSQHREAIERVLQGKEMLDEEFRIVLPDGRVRWLAGRGMLLHSSDGSPRTMLGVNYDVTERREAAQALQHLNETLEEQVAKRTEVLRKRTAQLRRTTIEVTKAEESVKQRVANTLHNELQQVLVSARLQLSRARNDDIPAETVARLNRIDETTKMAIDQLRTLSTELSPPILQHGTLTEVVRWAAARTEDQHGIVVDTQEVAEIEAGERELTQLVYDAVRELLLNVVKHAGSDRADVGMRLKKGNLHLVVRDRGKGCDDEIMKALNEGRGNYGTFTITERVRMLKGRVRFTSPRGKGCKVELRVPMTESAMEAAEKASSEGLPAAVVSDDSGQTRVLVVDDHDIARRGITATIEEREDLVVVGDAREGAEAVALAQSLQPDLVLLDVNLSGMSGPATARALRQHVPDAVIIAISVDDSEAARKSMADAGAVAFVAKDVAQETLLEVIDRHR
jgi:PAS domain S-box-containing protein